ncbi:MAG: helix-turn-helix domain-containing protein [Fimbriimonadaceae bacterium]|nr:helix-turn-helix domain-containing protein [Fimbriimonadaceae bacterium]
MRSHSKIGVSLPHTRLAKAIRVRRRDLGLTQTEAAELAGCTRLFVSEVERGKQTVRFDKLLNLLQVLGLQLALETGKSKLEVRVDAEIDGN